MKKNQSSDYQELKQYDLYSTQEFKEGQRAENELKNWLENESIEVKFDKECLNTGNLFIETHQKHSDNYWRESGINVCSATYFAIGLQDFNDKIVMFMLFTTEWLSQRIEKFHGAHNPGYKEKNNPTYGKLVPINQIYISTEEIREKNQSLIEKAAKNKKIF
jgi:hypothetical protein